MANILNEIWPLALFKNQTGIWGHWIKKLPETLLVKNQLLHARYAFLLLGEKKQETAEQKLNVIYNSLRENIRNGTPAPEPLTGTVETGLAYLAQLKGNIERTRFFTEKILENRSRKDPFQIIQAESLLGLTYLNMGEPVKAREIYTRNFNRVREAEDFTNIFGMGFVLAEELAQTSLAIGWQHRIHKAKGRLETVSGNYSNADKEYINAEKYRYQTPLPDFPSLESLKTKAALLHYLNTGTLIPSDMSRDLEMEIKNPAKIPEYINCQLANLINRNEINKTLSELESLESLIINSHNHLYLIETGILITTLRLYQGKKKLAADKMESVLNRIKIEKIVQPLFDYKKIITNQIMSSGIKDAISEKNRKLLFDIFPRSINPKDELSQREKEVLQLISQGYSNQQIAEALFVALDTIKGHNKRIFEKLQVRNRTEAVRKARDLSII